MCDPNVVRNPRVSVRSLIAIGSPCSGFGQQLFARTQRRDRVHQRVQPLDPSEERFHDLERGHRALGDELRQLAGMVEAELGGRASRHCERALSAPGNA